MRIRSLSSSTISPAAGLVAATFLTGANAWSTALSRSGFVVGPPIAGRTTTAARTIGSAARGAASSSSLFLSSKGGGDLATTVRAMGLNELQTQFRRAIAREDMDACIVYRDELAGRVSAGAYYESDKDERRTKRLNWGGLGTAPWLIERLTALEFALPTTVQINSFESVNAMLDPAAAGLASKETKAKGSDEYADIDKYEHESDDTLEERMQKKGTPPSMGVVISGSTGSGKTLAYLAPTLSTLSQTLFTRQRIRIKAEEDVGDVMGDMLDRVMVQSSPALRGQGYEQVGGGGGAITATGTALSSLGRSGTDVKSPVALIVVPTRELGVQISLLLYQLVGGNIKKSATERAGKKSMFRYQGPKGVKIGCVLDEVMAVEGLKLQTDVAIVTPKYLSKLLRDGDVDPSKLRVVVYDEADLALERSDDEDLKLLFGDEQKEAREFSRITYLVGATVTESLGSLAVRDEILPEGKSFIATATRFAPLTEEGGGDARALEDDAPAAGTDGVPSSLSPNATFRDLRLCLDPGLRHERVVAPNDTGLLCLARMLRKELRNYETDLAEECERRENGEEEVDPRSAELAQLREDTKDLVDPISLMMTSFDITDEETIDGVQRPRVVVFFPDEVRARDAMASLRDAMWGDHRLCVLLPDTGQSPLKIMEDFKKGDTSVMIATPNSVRGLDFPALTHVYTLYLPVDDPREFLHLAGRVGRIGQQGNVQGRGGRVTTILHPDEASQMDRLSELLGFEFSDLEPLSSDITEESDVEDVRRYLEDTMLLLNTVDKPEGTGLSVDDDNTSSEDDDEGDEMEEEA